MRALVLATVVLWGCAAALRERTTPFPPSARRAVPWALSRELLMPVNRRIVIAVELRSGHVPETWALDRLAALAGRYGERPAAWRVLGTPGAPPLRVIGARLTADAPLDADVSYVLVRYLGDGLERFGFGLSYDDVVNGHIVHVIAINQEAHRRWSWLLPERHLEAQTLIHEYGHLLGLPPHDHGYYPGWPDLSEGAHCVNPNCALAKPRLRALIYGLYHVLLAHHYLEDYCDECRAAIAAAKRWWRAAERVADSRQAR